MAAVLSPQSTNPSASPTSLSNRTSPTPHAALSQLPPIATANPQRRPSNKRTKSNSKSRQSTHSAGSQPPNSKRTSQSYNANRLSTLSTTSRTSRTNSQSNLRSASRTASTVFPLFHSSLPYTLVRDFGYPAFHPQHYGPAPESSELATPASESNRRLSDPVPSWEGGRLNWSASPGEWPTAAEYNAQGEGSFKLPNTSFSDDGPAAPGGWSWKRGDGPPYSEDEDLQSPVISTHGHRKQHSNIVGFDRSRGRPRSREVAAGGQGQDALASKRRKKKGRKRDIDADADADSDEDEEDTGKRQSRTTLPSRSFHQGETYSDEDSDGDSDEDEESDSDSTPVLANSPHHILRTRAQAFADSPHPDIDEDNPSRHSMTYTFSIASPDEECTGKAVSLYNFERENDNELPLTEGQIILVSYRLSQGWLVAQDPRTGESGLVPESYVRLFRDLEGWDGQEGDEELDSPGIIYPNNAGAAAELEQARHLSESPESGAEEAAAAARGGPRPGSTSAEPKTPTQATQSHKPAMTSTFSTSRDDLEPRRDLLAQEGRRGSLDRRSGESRSRNSQDPPSRKGSEKGKGKK